MKQIYLSLLICTGLLMVALPKAQAKDLSSRLGLGYRNALVSFDLPSVGAVYYPSSNTGIVGALGVDTQENNSKFGLQVGVRRIIFMEQNMNFFMGGNVAMVSAETPTATGSDKDSGFEIAALVGAEFFIQGLDSLGFNFETGAGVSNVDSVRFRTLGDSFLRGGMFFYF